tara:strand:+ start:115 stop:408 length:294 start_codon:yes stop_codon:yes gene_type:complete
MKKLILSLALLLPLSAHAEQSNCQGVSSLARVIMESRQTGVNIIDVINAVDDNELAKVIIIEAYKDPKFSTDDYKKTSINEFASRWYIICLKEKEED